VLETGGHRQIARLPPAVVKIVDGERVRQGSGKNHMGNPSPPAGAADEVKFVVADRPTLTSARRDLRCTISQGAPSRS